MSLIAKDKGGADFEPLPAGMHHAVCYGIVDLGTQPCGQFEPKRKVAFLWEIPAERITIEGKDRPRGSSGIWTLSLHKKSTLRPMLESWRGRPFTDQELQGFDLKNVLGANCFLNIVHKKGSGQHADRTYANVASVNPLAKGMPRVQSENVMVFFSLDECGDKITVPELIPDWLKKKIMDSEECRKEQRASSNPEPVAEEMASVGAENLDEDVPF